MNTECQAVIDNRIEALKSEIRDVEAKLLTLTLILSEVKSLKDALDAISQE